MELYRRDKVRYGSGVRTSLVLVKKGLYSREIGVVEWAEGVSLSSEDVSKERYRDNDGAGRRV